MSHKVRSYGAAGFAVFLCLLLSGCAGSGGSSGSASTGSSSSSGSTGTTTQPTSTPAVDSIAPAKAVVGTSSLALTVSGSNFTSTSTATVGGVSAATAYVSATQLSVTVAAGQLAAGGFLPVIVSNGSANSASGPVVNLEVDNPSPAITSFTPTSFAVAAAPASVSLIGTGFVAGTVVNVNGSARSTTFVSPTQISAALTAADFANASNLSITAVNATPGGGTSAAASVPVTNPAPTLVNIAPALTYAGNTNPVTVSVTGMNFVPGSTVNIGTATRPTTYVSGTQLTAILSVADVAIAGGLRLTVVNPAPGGGVSAGAPFTIAAQTPTPVLSALLPSTLLVGSANTTMFVTGSNLFATCQLFWNTTALSFSYSSGTYINNVYTAGPILVASVPASLLTSLGTASVTASCPTAATPVSNALTATVGNPIAPTLTSISPSNGAVGKDVKVTLTGTDFTSKSTVAYNGVSLATTYNSATSLSATLPANVNVLPGNGAFTISTPAPGGGTSAAVPFTAYVALVNNDMIYNPVSGLFYMSVPSSVGAPYGNTVVSIDPVTGAFGTPILVGSEPNRLALTSDGKYLWVGIDGANAVRKVDLTTGTPGLQFAIPQQGTNSVGGSNAYALAALPGATDSVIVSSANFPNYFSIYDSGVPRGTPVSGYYTQPYAILTDGTKNEVYASGSAGYQVFTYGASGLTQKTSNGTGPGVQSGGDLQIAGGKLYGSNSKIYDPESGALLATLYASGSNVANGSTFADASLNKIFVLDSTSGGFSYYGQNQVQVFSATDYTSVGSIPVSLDTNTYSGGNRLTRWGANGVAFRTSAGFYTLRSSQVKDLSGTTADLAISLTSSGTTTSSPVTFTATIKNNGGSAASNVAFAGFLPSNGKLVGVTTSAGTCYTAGTLTCDLGSLANGAAATVTVSIQPATAGNLVFAASVAGTEPDTVSSNNTASLTAAVTGADYVPAPTVSSLSPAAIKAGASDTTLTINGTGFTSGSVVTLGSATLSAKLVSSAQLTVTVPAANLASMGWLPLTVSNTGTGASAPVALTVFNVVTAGLNHIAYEPFTRKLFASVGSGSAALTGNSIVQLTPESGTFSTPVNIGSQPTRFTITSSGNYLYANLSGSNTLARFNIPTNTTEFAFTPGTPTNYYYGSTATFNDLAAQPGSDTVLAVNYSNGGIGLVDVDSANKKGTLRGGTTTGTFSSIYAGNTQFADAGTLYIFDNSLERYPIGTGALSSTTTHTSTYLQYFGTFNISGSYAYADSGGLANLSGSAPVQAGIFKQLGNGIYGQKVVGDAALGKAYFVGSTSSSSSSTDGIIAYDQTTLLPVQSLSLGMATIEGNSSFNVTDVVRWGQDGLAVLTSTGHTYLLRGPAVLPQLLSTASAATLDSSQSASLTHGSANTLLKLTGTNFAPGVVVTWNGDNRSTTFMDANHVTVALPASDLISAGTATLTVTNPGAPASATQSITVQ